MTQRVLEKLFEHNNWANTQIIRICSTLSDGQLDAKPQSATAGSIRETLFHLATSQGGYLRLLTLPVEERRERLPNPPFAELEKFTASSGEALQALARDDAGSPTQGRLQTTDDYWLEPWVVMVQIIDHAAEHREQIKSMLSALGVTPPSIDGWDYGEATGMVIPVKPAPKPDAGSLT